MREVSIRQEPMASGKMSPEMVEVGRVGQRVEPTDQMAMKILYECLSISEFERPFQKHLLFITGSITLPLPLSTGTETFNTSLLSTLRFLRGPLSAADGARGMEPDCRSRASLARM